MHWGPIHNLCLTSPPCVSLPPSSPPCVSLPPSPPLRLPPQVAEAEAGGEAGGAAGVAAALAPPAGRGSASAAHAGPDVQRERGQALQVHGAAVLPLLRPAPATPPPPCVFRNVGLLFVTAVLRIAAVALFACSVVTSPVFMC